MSIRGAIYDLLNDYEADVYPYVAKQDATDPYVVYHVRREAVRTQDGVSAQEVILTLNYYATDLDDVITLAATIYTGLEGTSGTYDSETLHSTSWASEDGYYISDLEKYNLTQEYKLIFLT